VSLDLRIPYAKPIRNGDKKSNRENGCAREPYPSLISRNFDFGVNGILPKTKNPLEVESQASQPDDPLISGEVFHVSTGYQASSSSHTLEPAPKPLTVVK
jgi:hypothetical protein